MRVEGLFEPLRDRLTRRNEGRAGPLTQETLRERVASLLGLEELARVCVSESEVSLPIRHSVEAESDTSSELVANATSVEVVCRWHVVLSCSKIERDGWRKAGWLDRRESPECTKPLESFLSARVALPWDVFVEGIEFPGPITVPR